MAQFTVPPNLGTSDSCIELTRALAAELKRKFGTHYLDFQCGLDVVLVEAYPDGVEDGDSIPICKILIVDGFELQIPGEPFSKLSRPMFLEQYSRTGHRESFSVAASRHYDYNDPNSIDDLIFDIWARTNIREWRLTEEQPK